MLLLLACASHHPAAPSVTAPAITRMDEGALQSLLANSSTEVLVVNFWASWCGPCGAEMGTLHRVAEANPSVRFALVSLDDASDQPALEVFLRRYNVTLPVYHLAVNDPGGVMSRNVTQWSSVIPLTLVIEPGGNVVQSIDGIVDPVFLDAEMR